MSFTTVLRCTRLAEHDSCVDVWCRFVQDMVLVTEHLPELFMVAIFEAREAGDRQQWTALIEACLAAAERLARTGFVCGDIKPRHFQLSSTGRWECVCLRTSLLSHEIHSVASALLFAQELMASDSCLRSARTSQLQLPGFRLWRHALGAASCS